ncbi:Uncharacterised protein [Mycobacterium tuberculosis]|nr:Uncharacterised protein [Mycobacterium tuberculosis]
MPFTTLTNHVMIPEISVIIAPTAVRNLCGLVQLMLFQVVLKSDHTVRRSSSFKTASAFRRSLPAVSDANTSNAHDTSARTNVQNACQPVRMLSPASPMSDQSMPSHVVVNAVHASWTSVIWNASPRRRKLMPLIP